MIKIYKYKDSKNSLITSIIRILVIDLIITFIFNKVLIPYVQKERFFNGK